MRRGTRTLIIVAFILAAAALIAIFGRGADPGCHHHDRAAHAACHP